MYRDILTISASLRLLLGMVAYLGATFIAIDCLDPLKQPPGFTGKGAWAVIIVLSGTYHLAKYNQWPALYLAFGCAGAMLLIRPFLYGPSLVSLMNSLPRQYFALRELVGWIMFVLGVGFVARFCAMVRWRTWRRQGPGFCRICGYDLRATPNRCPECGTVSQPGNTTMHDTST